MTLKYSLKYSKLELSNGLVVMFYRMPGNISVRLTVNAGPINDPENKKGVGHFLEHLIMKGSRKYSDDYIVKTIQRLPNEENYTSLDNTEFIMNARPKHLEPYLSILSDCVFYPKLERAVFERQKKRILKEFIAEENENNTHDEYRLLETLFDGPAGQNPGGSTDSVREIALEDLREFHEMYYHPNMMYMVLTGNLPNNVEDLVKGFFSEKDANGVSRMELSPEPMPTKEKIRMIRRNGLNAAKLMLAFRTGYGYPKIEEGIEMELVSHVLVGGEYSRIFKRLSDELGDTYAILHDLNDSLRNGYLSINSDTDLDPEKLQECSQMIREELERLNNGEISEEELEVAADVLLYNLEEKMLDRIEMIDMIAKHHNFGISPEMIANALSSVDKNRVVEISRKYLDWDKRTEVVIVPE